MQKPDTDSKLTQTDQNAETQTVEPTLDSTKNSALDAESLPKETGGPKGLEPTRYGDWERKGRCIDF